MMKQENSIELTSANIGVITALPEEYVAVCRVLGCKAEKYVPGTGAGRKYSVGKLRTIAGVEQIVAVALMSDMGNNSAAIRATQMGQHCPKVEFFIMAGIAGAVPNHQKAEEHVRLGDIVVTDRNGIVQYDLDKEEPEITKQRHAPRPPGATLLEAVRSLVVGEMKRKRPWESYIAKATSQLGTCWKRPGATQDVLRDDELGATTPHPKDLKRRKSKPQVFHGPIASANKLLKNPAKRDALRDRYGVKAVEMEGSGIADTAWNLEKEYLVVRGTCDYCNPDKGDAWHNYAALAAAAYVRCVIEAMSPPISNEQTSSTRSGSSSKEQSPQVQTDFALPDWKRLYRKEIKRCVTYSYNGSRHLLPQVLILDNTKRKEPLQKFSMRLRKPAFDLPSDVHAMTDGAFNSVSVAVGSWTDDENLRLYDLNNRGLVVQGVRYEAYLRTNLSLDYRRREGLASLRESVHRNGRLETLPESPLANNLGINILLFTPDGSLVLQERSNTVAFRRGELCSAASGTMSICDVTIPITLNHVRLLREGREELGIHTADVVEERLHLLGITRELIRGGQPEMFFFTESHLESSQLVARWGRAPDKHEAEKLIFYPFDREVISGSLTGKRRARFQKQFGQFIDDHGDNASIPLLTNLALWQQWRLTEK